MIVYLAYRLFSFLLVSMSLLVGIQQYNELLSTKSEIDKIAIKATEIPTREILKRYGLKNFPNFEVADSSLNRIEKRFEGNLSSSKKDMLDLYFTIAAREIKAINTNENLINILRDNPFSMKNLSLKLTHNGVVKYHDRNRIISIENQPEKDLLIYYKLSEDGEFEVAHRESVESALRKTSKKTRELYQTALIITEEGTVR